MRLASSTSITALVAAMACAGAAQAQVANTSPSNVNVLNLLSPFLRLNADATGRATLQTSLDEAARLNNTASSDRRAQAISDKALPGSPPFLGTITLANGAVVPLGPADNLAGGVSGDGVAGFVTASGNTATLTINRTSVDYAGAGSTANQRSVSAGLNRGAATNTSATAGGLLNTLFSAGQV